MIIDLTLGNISRAELSRLLLCLRAEKRQLGEQIKQFEENFRWQDIRIGLVICVSSPKTLRIENGRLLKREERGPLEDTYDQYRQDPCSRHVLT